MGAHRDAGRVDGGMCSGGVQAGWTRVEIGALRPPSFFAEAWRMIAMRGQSSCENECSPGATGATCRHRAAPLGIGSLTAGSETFWRCSRRRQSSTPLSAPIMPSPRPSPLLRRAQPRPPTRRPRLSRFDGLPPIYSAPARTISHLRDAGITHSVPHLQFLWQTVGPRIYSTSCCRARLAATGANPSHLIFKHSPRRYIGCSSTRCFLARRRGRIGTPS